MKQLAFAVGLLAAGLFVSTPARADYAIVQFDDGHCQIWWDSAGNPWGTGWTKIALGLPDYPAAEATIDGAVVQGVCR
jgi:hypothetical protein